MPHVLSKTATSGVTVIHLDGESKIPPSVNAMLQAKYSRDPGTVLRHIKDLEAAQDRGKKFMADYYVGYGHRSIARCDGLTLFVEGVSILAAMWLVHTPKFNGQECSTRYLDFLRQGYLLGLLSEEDRAACEKMITECLAFYEKSMEVQKDYVRSLNACPEGTSTANYERTVKAKAFDVLRGFLPMGMRTNVAITMNMCDFEDHVLTLMANPLAEVREVGATMLEVLRKVEPETFSRTPSEETIELLRQEIVELSEMPIDLASPTAYPLRGGFFDLTIHKPNAFRAMCRAVRASMASTRPHLVHRDYESCATGRLVAEMDAGSLRDIKRHTSADHRVGVIGCDLGFEEWYVSSLAPELQEEARKMIALVTEAHSAILKRSKVAYTDWELQYMVPLGFKAQVDMCAGMRSWSYILPLRSGTTVHQTLRVVAGAALEAISENSPLDLGAKSTAEVFDLKRGTQDILRKEDLAKEATDRKEKV